MCSLLVFFFLCYTLRSFFISIIQLTNFYSLCLIGPLRCWFYGDFFHFQKHNLSYFSIAWSSFIHLLFKISLYFYICIDRCFWQLPSVRRQETLGHFENCLYWLLVNVLGKHVEGRDRASSLT